jgi:predicted RNA-binding protein with RPS1 domain
VTDPLCSSVFIDCGLGCIDGKGKWQIVTGMLRIGGRGMKETVIRKKVTKLRKKEGGIPVFVSKVYKASSRIEVVTDSSLLAVPAEPKIGVGALRKDQELIGTVRRLENFGALIDVGANRLGLLHIQKVADLYGRFIDKTKGLEEAGLEVGARIRVEVAELDQRRLFLDFTPDVRKEAAEEQKQKAKELQLQKEARIQALAQREAELQKQKVARMQALADRESGKVSQAAEATDVESEMEDQPSFELSDEEAAAWAAYAGGDAAAQPAEGDDGEDDDEYYDDDEEDEDTAIEDALGIGGW